MELLLMAEILHQLRWVVYPIIYRVSYIPGSAGFSCRWKLVKSLGSVGFSPNTVDGSEIRRENRLGCIVHPVNNVINYQSQLVSLPDFWLPSTVCSMYKWGFIPFHSPFIHFLPGASSQLGSMVVKHGDRFWCAKDRGCGLPNGH